MYCQKCGSKIESGSSFCTECGNQINNIEHKVNSESSFGWGVLGFFVPIAGLILYLTWNKNRPEDAKAAGIGALIYLGFCVIMLIFILTCISSFSSIYY
jgi:drug/metabolite transporter (DMT)-like permease